MFVAIVTAPGWPASTMIWASFSCCFALRTLCGMPCRVSSSERCSETSTEIVPTSTGWPFAWRSLMSSITAPCFASSVLKIWSFLSSRATSTLVGISTTFRP